MSYTVLAVKWRPRRFGDLVGQQHVVQALVNSLAGGRLHHAYLFTGTRGVGKTTVARILAKALNCEQGVVPEPCGVCSACTAIDEGRFVDLLEVDAASRTKVDDTRELLDNVQYAPTRGRFKVYLIDEVHMLSTHSFNALLKTLEEPPPHVKFLLATTDPQKLPVTVLSRCLQFNLKRLTVAQIQAQLENVCAAEGVLAEHEGLKALAKAADGSMRDALSMLDQGIAFGDGEIKAELVNSMLGTVDRGHVLRILEALAAEDGAALLDEVDRLDERAPDYGAVLDELMSALQRLAVIQLVGERGPDEDLETLRPLAEKLSPEDVQLYFQIALHGKRDLPVSRDHRIALEMTLLRMLAFRPAGEDVDAGPQARSRSAAEGPAARRAGNPAAAPRDAAAAPEGDDALRNGYGAATPPGRPRAAPKDHAAAPERTATYPSPANGPANRTHHGPAGPEPASVRDDAALGPGPGRPAWDGQWASLVRAAEVRGAARQLADHCELAGMTEQRLDVILAADREALNTQQVRVRLEQAIAEYLGRPITLAIRPGKPPRPTPAEVRAATENERMRRARETMEQDPNVKATQEAFGAVLEPDTIQPRNTSD